MPNWCSNNVTLEHDDPAMIARAIEAFEAGKLLQEFVPCPQELLEGTSPASEEVAQANIEKHGSADWYQWCVENWGTKWDINCEGFDAEASNEGRSVFLAFDTAWGPPLEFYRTIEDDLGFRVRASYFEPGMAMVGKWEDGENQHYEIDTENLDEIPADLAEEWDITSWFDDEDDEENMGIDLDDGLSATNEDSEE